MLEVATGSGEMFRRLVRANAGGTTVGVDLSPNMAARTQRTARQKYPHARSHCQAVDARHMPFRNESFDAIFCCYLLELLSADDIVCTLAEFRRILRDRGNLTLVLIGQNTASFNAVYKVLGQGGSGLLGPPGGTARAGSDSSGALPDSAGSHGPADLLPLSRFGRETIE